MARLLRQYRVHFALLFLTSTLSGLVEAAFLVLATRIALAIANDRSMVGIVQDYELSTFSAMLLAALLIAIRLGISLVDVRVQIGLAYRVTTGLRKQLADAFLNASWPVQRAQPAGSLQQIVVTFPNRAGDLLGTLTASGSAAVSLTGLMLVALLVDPRATITILIALAFLSAVLGPLRRRIGGRSRKALNQELAFANRVSELGSICLEVQTFGTKNRVTEILHGTIEDNAAAQRHVRLIADAVSPIYVSLAYGAVVGALLVVDAVGSGRLESIGAVMLVMLRSLGYGQQLQSGSAAISQIEPFLAQVTKTIDEYSQTPSKWGDQVPPTVTPIRFTNVSFSYGTDSAILNNLNLVVDKGETVGIIGPSGTGKSTLLQLLLGLRPPTSGQVSACGHDLRALDRLWWTRRTALVSQDAHLITGTVADNVRFFRDDIDEETLKESLRQASLLDEITRLPDGVNTHLGESAHKLSGGQRQRLCIARALAGQPELLVLDEPTSALDFQAEDAIRSTIRSLKGRVTVILVAHRPSLLEECDRVLDLSTPDTDQRTH